MSLYHKSIGVASSVNEYLYEIEYIRFQQLNKRLYDRFMQGIIHKIRVFNKRRNIIMHLTEDNKLYIFNVSNLSRKVFKLNRFAYIKDSYSYIKTSRGRFFFGGGYEYENPMQYSYTTSSFNEYDFEHNKIITRPNMIDKRSLFQYAELNTNIIVAVGGYNDGKIRECEYYNIQENKWSPMDELVRERSENKLFSFNNHILYTIGGCDRRYNDFIERIELDHSMNGEWECLNVRNQQICERISSYAVLKISMDEILIAGGHKFALSTDRCIIYNITDNEVAYTDYTLKYHAIIPNNSSMVYNNKCYFIDDDITVHVFEDGKWNIMRFAK